MQRKLGALSLATVLLATVLQPASLLAHDVALWAEVRDNRVWVEAYDTEGSGVRDARLLVEDADGKLLLEGKTDQKGQFDFAPPNKNEMILKLEMDAHHKSRFTLKAEDLKDVVLERTGG